MNIKKLFRRKFINFFQIVRHHFDSNLRCALNKSNRENNSNDLLFRFTLDICKNAFFVAYMIMILYFRIRLARI